MNSRGDFPVHLSGASSVPLPHPPSLHHALMFISGRQKISNMIALSVFTGSVLGIYAWAGGIGGYSAIYGIDTHEAMKYRRDYRFRESNYHPIEEYEQAIRRRAHPEDFSDITAVVGDAKRIYTPTDAMGIHPIPVPNGKRWWEDVLEQHRAQEKAAKEAGKK
jgi:hypothetical protein